MITILGSAPLRTSSTAPCHIPVQLPSFRAACLKLSPYHKSLSSPPQHSGFPSWGRAPRHSKTMVTPRPCTLQSLVLLLVPVTPFRCIFYLISNGTFLSVHQPLPPSVSLQYHLPSPENFILARSMLFFAPLTWPDCFHF